MLSKDIEYEIRSKYGPHAMIVRKEKIKRSFIEKLFLSPKVRSSRIYTCK